MRSSTIIMIAVAAIFGLLAVFVAQSWLNRQAEARLRRSPRTHWWSPRVRFVSASS
jgi:Flp pilus assembly protein CpaB